MFRGRTPPLRIWSTIAGLFGGSLSPGGAWNPDGAGELKPDPELRAALAAAGEAQRRRRQLGVSPTSPSSPSSSSSSSSSSSPSSGSAAQPSHLEGRAGAPSPSSARPAEGGQQGGNAGASMSVAEHRANIAAIRRRARDVAEKAGGGDTGGAAGRIGVANGGVDPLAEHFARFALITRLCRSSAKDDIRTGIKEGTELFDELVEMLQRGPLPRARGLKMSLCSAMQAAHHRLGEKAESVQWAFKLDDDKLGLADFVEWENQERRYFGQPEIEPTPSQKFSKNKRMRTKAELDQFAIGRTRFSQDAGRPVLGDLMEKSYIGPRWT